jgi:hypothetical protein
MKSIGRCKIFVRNFVILHGTSNCNFLQEIFIGVYIFWGLLPRIVLQRHCIENSKQIFPEMKLRGLFPYSYIHESVSDLYFSTIGPPILLQ